MSIFAIANTFCSNFFNLLYHCFSALTSNFSFMFRHYSMEFDTEYPLLYIQAVKLPKATTAKPPSRISHGTAVSIMESELTKFVRIPVPTAIYWQYEWHQQLCHTVLLPPTGVPPLLFLKLTTDAWDPVLPVPRQIIR